MCTANYARITPLVLEVGGNTPALTTAFAEATIAAEAYKDGWLYLPAALRVAH